MATSYFLSNHFYELAGILDIGYLLWLAYDLVAIASLILIHKLLKLPLSVACKYVLLGLSLNSVLFISMHIDRFVLLNDTHWWLWTVYSLMVNVFDLMMVAALILNRDFLLILRAKKQIKHFLFKRFQKLPN
ncbi:hypothetical protein [Pseudoalteromonas sp. S16_S37]|uniref:hypothetical protein n=1 Tax=Pseudoalteromonas sp. S16_S37 TaxID=2720228 RepID=UPI00167FF6F9|nr:hypothetical protein [Pseudoalteromonas sp. S16_S37]MBD1582077.1 hypothetical protein [Pseudoalteromonas sp. S16_S37]